MAIRRLLFALTGTAALACSFGVVTGIAGASTKVGVSHVSEVNISDQSFSLTFMTSIKVTKAAMLVGSTCKSATTRAAEIKGSNGFVHVVNAPSGLKPASIYWAKLKLDGVADGCFRMHTYASSNVPPPPDAIYGTNGVAKTCGPKTTGKAAPGSLVLVDVRHNGTASDPLAALADSKGRWVVPFGEATTQSGQWVKPGAGDLIEITGWLNKSRNDFDSLSYNGSSKLVGPWSVCI